MYICNPGVKLLPAILGLGTYEMEANHNRTADGRRIMYATGLGDFTVLHDVRPQDHSSDPAKLYHRVQLVAVL